MIIMNIINGPPTARPVTNDNFQPLRPFFHHLGPGDPLPPGQKIDICEPPKNRVEFKRISF